MERNFIKEEIILDTLIINFLVIYFTSSSFKKPFREA